VTVPVLVALGLDRAWGAGETVGEGSGSGVPASPVPVSLWHLTPLQRSATGDARRAEPCRWPYRLPAEGVCLGGLCAKARGSCKNSLKLIWMPKWDPR